MSRKQIKLNHQECHIIIELLQENRPTYTDNPKECMDRHKLIMKMFHLGDLARGRMDYGYIDEDIEVTQGEK